MGQVGDSGAPLRTRALLWLLRRWGVVLVVFGIVLGDADRRERENIQ